MIAFGTHATFTLYDVRCSTSLSHHQLSIKNSSLALHALMESARESEILDSLRRLM